MATELNLGRSNSGFFEDYRKVFTAATVGIASGGALWYYLSQLYAKRVLPTTWEEVGEVEEVSIYPLKSAKPIPVKSADATPTGMQLGNLSDRSFLMVNDKGQMVTGRECKLLVTVATAFENDKLTLTSLEGDKITLDIHEIMKKDKIKFLIRGDDVTGYDCGDEVSVWLSKALYNGNKKPRLMYTGLEEFSRKKRIFEFFDFPHFEKDDSTRYFESCSYMFMTKESMRDLNSRLDKPINFGFFRPCVVIGKSKPFDEDNWDFIKIGENAVFHVAKPCERCILTTIDPKTGQYTKDHFEELLKYRRIQYPEALSKQWKQKPIFGVLCGIDVTGKVSVGDKVYVSRPKKQYWSV